ncbi:Histone-lysine N-methyltransferase SUVR5 [Hordeum vulgare]|nr:Histone-lysine N-methyltransferase SUVR5 [Hordeum vulgare]
MQQIFSFGLATGKHALGFGQSIDLRMPDYPHSPESETIILDGPDKDGDHVPMLDRKRKRNMEACMHDKLSIFISMTQSVKEATSPIRERKSDDVQPDL